MNEEKKVPFKWEYGEETISLQLGMYANNQRLYIGMITHTEDGAEPFADMTVNLPGYSLDPGEAFISGDISKDLLRFIKEQIGEGASLSGAVRLWKIFCRCL